MTTLKDTANPLESVAWLITYASTFDSRIKTDPLKESVWLEQLADYDPHLIKRGIAAYYSNPDKARWEITPGVLLSWCQAASPKRERCPDHPSYYAGSTCGGCRADRLELGLEKPIAPSTLPKPRELESTPPNIRAITASIGKTLQEPA